MIRDLTGKRFGKLTVLRDSGRRSKSRGVIWCCICECGIAAEVVSSSLVDGKTNSCGCLQKESATKKHFKDLSGKTFGQLTVLYRGETVNKRTIFRCLCSCGKQIDVRQDGLTTGHTKSCGCWNMKVLKSKVGKNSPSYKTHITDEEREKGRFLFKSKLDKWRLDVFGRDDFTCQSCLKRGVKLHAHHLNSYHWDKENRFNTENGVTLCAVCHMDFHNKFGRVNNNKLQFHKYLKEKEMTQHA